MVLALIVSAPGRVAANELAWRQAMANAKASLQRGQASAALAAFQRALEQARAIGGTDWRVGAAAFGLAEALRLDGRYNDARSHYRLAGTVYQSEFGANAPILADVHLGLAELEAETSGDKASSAALEAAATIGQENFGEASAHLYPALKTQLRDAQRREDFEGQRRLLRSAGDLEELPPYARAELKIASAVLKRQGGDLRAARVQILEVIDELRARLSTPGAPIAARPGQHAEPRDPEPNRVAEEPLANRPYADALVAAQRERGAIHLALAEFASASEALQSALQLTESLHSPAHPGRIELLLDLTKISLAAGELREAEAHAGQAQSAANRALRDDHPQRLPVMLNSAAVDRAAGRYEAAALKLSRAQAQAERSLPVNHQARLSIALAKVDLALSYAPPNTWPGQLAWLDEVVATTGASPDVATDLRFQAATAQRDFAAAARIADLGLSAARSRLGPSHPFTLRAELRAAKARISNPKTAVDIAAIQAIRESMAAALGPGHPDVVDAGRVLALARLRHGTLRRGDQRLGGSG